MGVFFSEHSVLFVLLLLHDGDATNPFYFSTENFLDFFVGGGLLSFKNRKLLPVALSIVREHVFYVFSKSKNANFYVFGSVMSKNVKNVQSVVHFEIANGHSL